MKFSKTVSVHLLSLALMAGAAFPVRAEVNEIGVVKQFGIAFLQLMVMEHDQLIEKYLRAAGLNDVRVHWVTLGSGAGVNDALLSGAVNFASAGPAPFLTLWSKTVGNAKAEVKGVSALNSVPHYLNTRDSAVHSVKDFSDNDRIALPAVKASNQAILLEMAAAKAFGDENYAKLDRLTVSMSHPNAMVALLSGASEITAHFTAPPYQYYELAQPAIHTVLTSYDILGGPVSFNIMYTTVRFHDENPLITASFVAALKEATDFINHDKQKAAEIYLAMEKSKLSADAVLKTISDPLVSFTLVPQRVMQYAEFMKKVGAIKTAPTSLEDLFFKEARSMGGS